MTVTQSDTPKDLADVGQCHCRVFLTFSPEILMTARVKLWDFDPARDSEILFKTITSSVSPDHIQTSNVSATNIKQRRYTQDFNH